MTALATALALTLEPGSALKAPRPAWAAAAGPGDQDANVVPLRSSFWVPAGGYGMATTFAGGAAILTEYSTRALSGRNVRPPLIAMGLGLLLGAVPGLLLGQNAREEDNDRARGAVGVLDLAGTGAMILAFKSIYRKED